MNLKYIFNVDAKLLYIHRKLKKCGLKITNMFIFFKITRFSGERRNSVVLAEGLSGIIGGMQ